MDSSILAAFVVNVTEKEHSMIEQQDTITQEVAPYSGPTWTPSLEQLIAAWLHAKHGRSQSSETLRTYSTYISQFREVLQAAGIDFDGPPSMVALLAQGWAAQVTDVESIAPATYNLRITTLSSFFEYGIKHDVFTLNPMRKVDRRSVESQDYALPLDEDEVTKRLAAIDRSTLIGLRDYAIISLAVTTGRRKQELANLRFGDFRFGGTKTVVTWQRTKGGGKMTDELTAGTSAAIVAYLQEAFGSRLGALTEDQPIWLICARNRAGLPMHASALRKIWIRHLGVPKIHTSRHTFACAMENAGARLSDIGAKLGHRNLSTTSIYMARLHAAENPFGQKLEAAFGIQQ